MTQHTTPRHRHLAVAILAIIILLAAGFVRFERIATPSLWMDEIWSIEMAMGHGSMHDHLAPDIIHTDQPNLTSLNNAAPWWSICTHLGGVTHPPLYFLILRAWIGLFGTSSLAARSLSAIFSLAAIIIFFDICRFLHSPKIALFAAAISALAIAQIDFAQEARAYPMLIFFSLCAADAVIRVEFLGPNPRRLIALTTCLVTAALTHYLAAGALISLAAYAALRLRGRARIQTLIAFAAGAIIVLLIWIPLFLDQKNTLPSLAPTFLREARVHEHSKLTLFRIIGLPVQFLLGESRGNSVRSALVLTLFLFTTAVPILRLYFRRDLLLWILWLLFTVGFVAALDLLHQTTLVGYLRYTFLASPAIYALLAAFDWPRQKFLRDAVPIATIGLLAIAAIQRTTAGVPPKQDWRTLAESINASAAPDELLVFFNPDPWTSPGTWYMGFKYYTPDSRHPWLILTGPATSKNLARELQSRHSLWLIGPDPETQGRDLLPGWTPQSLITTTAGDACRMIPTSAAVSQ